MSLHPTTDVCGQFSRRVNLPVGREGAQARVPGRAARVLVVDESGEQRDALSQLLELQGFDVFMASSSEVAIIAARRFPPDIVLLDISMPSLSGLDTARALRADTRAQGAFFVAMTALSTEVEIRRTRQAGCDACLPKPIEIDRLVGLLRQVVLKPAVLRARRTGPSTGSLEAGRGE